MQRRLTIWLAGLAVALGLAGLVGPGCSSVNRTAYQATGTARTTASLAVVEWNSYVASQHPPRAQQVAVRDAFDKWKAAMLLVCDAGEAYSKAVAAGQTNSVSSLALEAAMSNATQIEADLVNLVRQFEAPGGAATTATATATAPAFSELPVVLPK